MSKVKFEHIFGTMAVLLGIGFVMSKVGEAKGAMQPTEEEKLPLPDLEFFEPQGLGALPIAQNGGLRPNVYRVIGTWNAYPVDIRWIEGIFDYRNVYIAAYLNGTPFPGYVRVAQDGLIQLNNNNVYIGGNLATGIKVTAKTKGVYRIIIRAYTGPGNWDYRIYEFRG